MDNKKYAYRLLGFAVLVEAFVMTENLVYEIMKRISDNQTIRFAAVWLAAYLIWGAGFVLISKWSGIFRNNMKDLTTNRILFVLIMIVLLIMQTTTWGGFKPYIEFFYYIKILGPALGTGGFILQYLYYAFEAAMMFLILALGQKAGEIFFEKHWIPYGGLVLAILWGLPHLYTKGAADGFWSAITAVLYGLAYLAVRTKNKAAYPYIFVLFII